MTKKTLSDWAELAQKELRTSPETLTWQTPEGIAVKPLYTAEDLDIPDRILAVADIYDALASDRPYRKGMVEPVITSILERDRGTRLDPVALDALHAVRAEREAESRNHANHPPIGCV